MDYKESIQCFSLLMESMTQETAKRRVENITKALEGNKERLEEFKKDGDHRAVKAHESYIEVLERKLAEAKKALGMNEAVIRKQISPSARKEVEKSRKEHKRIDSELLAKKSKASDYSPELHAKTPLAPEKRKLLSDIFDQGENKSDELNIVRNKMGSSFMSPDDIWRINKDDKSEFIPFIYLPQTGEFFYISAGDKEKVDDNKYDMKRYFGGLNRAYRTHLEILEFIEVATDPYWKDKQVSFKKDIQFYNKFMKDRKVSTPDKNFIMGRWGRGLVSFWNALPDEKAEKIVETLKQTNNVPVDVVYIPTKTINR